MIRGPSDLAAFMTPESAPEEVIARRAAILLLNDSFGGCSYFLTKWAQAPEVDSALNLICLKE